MDELLSDPDSNDEQGEKVRFDLYRRQKEIQEISKILQQLSARGRNEQKEWLRENEEFVTGMAEDFVDDSLVQLDGVKMDSETVRLSVEVMTQLRETLGLFQAIVSGDDGLDA
ncbi:MAG: hypothetical protein COU63_01230 [Candidatus Pacebacteria bacterium CG10_big_fil_rev_8_21_14_0_10_36_11]|nr:MAG: hypothetical protein COU63_01230 [Candidatus Pacebacteria bacterium CG10_big_fil_rev_8_21_14_0_10_36_11]